MAHEDDQARPSRWVRLNGLGSGTAIFLTLRVAAARSEGEGPGCADVVGDACGARGFQIPGRI